MRRGGKATLLRCMNGLETIQSGEIDVCGHRVSLPGKLNRRGDLRVRSRAYG